MNCNDGTQRTMLIPEEGGVVIGNVQYQRAFQQAPVNFDDALPDSYPAQRRRTSGSNRSPNRSACRLMTPVDLTRTAGKRKLRVPARAFGHHLSP